jgi:hypothetical protein
MLTDQGLSLVVDINESRIPLRLAYEDEEGFPRIVSLWFEYCDGDYLCATHADSWIVKHLKARPKIGFEIATNEPPYIGVRGTGSVAVYPMADQPLLDDLLARYQVKADSEFGKFLLRRKDTEMVIRITPIKKSNWNYTKRMEGALAT